MANFTILGMGGFGLSLAVMLNNFGHHVTVWSAFQQEIDDIRRDGENKQKLPGVKISDEITLTDDMGSVSGADIVIFGIPTKKMREVAHKAAPYISKETVVVNTSKGLEEGTLKRMSEVLEEEIPENPIVVLSGPSHAEEVARSIPTAIVAASEDKEAARYIQEQLGSDKLRIYLNDDVIGCELGGALKNIIALCCGICLGMGYGDNTKAALMTRGIHEIMRLGVAAGADIITFGGLTGLGDLIVTCTSLHSRNARAGKLIGEGMEPAEAVRQVGTVEGYWCCHTAYELAKKLGVEMPITEQLNEVLFNGGKVQDAMAKLMGRPMIYEYDEIISG